MYSEEKRNVVFLPGGIQPAAIQYAPLLKTLKLEINPLLKDLEVYRDGTPPAGYSLVDEVEAVRQASEKAGMDSFHLVAYSGGGAVALAFTGAYPAKVRSLALSEPAVIPSQEWFRHEAAYWEQMGQLVSLPPEQFMQGFIKIELRPGVTMPPAPAGDPPPWMARRPAGIKALISAFSSYDLPYERLRAFTKPVYIAVAALSNPVELRKAEVLQGLFADMRLEIYPNLHHFDPPQRHEPERFARSLEALWAKAENVSTF
jgi:pimeloyl-ACP methyl ester carboxylesterase